MVQTQIHPPALRIMERMLTEGFAAGRTEVVDELCSPDIVEHQFDLAGTGAEALGKLKACMTAVHAAFPDLRFTVEDWTQTGDHDDAAPTIWVRARGAGTNTGPFLGAPTGLPVQFTVFDVARIEEGRIVEHWGVPDRFEVLVRTGRVAAGPR
ncbi:ester cyclase [Leifsonia sp. F6_8S_P_1B]|uniref:Ester cyclase n=1 Tax=Leifsonia williamsii TaxID=3035919 RepID=A0ABT8K8L2_9MICO|nr:ester cyclase [Leifsonia williamsii]MDN4613794.1 ester cyclase [Leifsonia williamsii]